MEKCARRADEAERQDEEDEAHPVAEEADHHRTADRRECGKPGAQRERDGQVDRARRAPFDRRYLDRVPRRDLLRQVVVDPPAEARPCHRERAQQGHGRLGMAARTSRCPLPRQQDASRHDQHHSEQDAAVEVLPKGEPGQERREDPFQIQKERCR
jgi:hypothetical protein